MRRLAGNEHSAQQHQDGQQENRPANRSEAEEHGPGERPRATPAGLLHCAERKLGSGGFVCGVHFPLEIAPMALEGVALRARLPDIADAGDPGSANSSIGRGLTGVNAHTQAAPAGSA